MLCCAVMSCPLMSCALQHSSIDVDFFLCLMVCSLVCLFVRLFVCLLFCLFVDRKIEEMERIILRSNNI